MNFKDMLNKISQLSEATKETGKGRIHTAEPGGYGRKDDEDDEGKKVKADAPKRGRGRPKKDADASGEVKKYDFSAFGVKQGKDIKLPKHDKDKTRKHSLKEYFDQLDTALNEAEQVTIQPAQSNTQVIKQGDKTLGTVTNPQLAAQIKQSIGRGEMSLTGSKIGEEMDEATGDYSAKKARAGKDIGKPGKQFSKIAKDAAQRYGSKERGEKVAGAVLAKLRAKTNEADMPPHDSLASPMTLEGKGAKPDFIDLDKDGNKKESMKKAAQDKKKVKEGMDHRLKAARHAGKAHALAKEGYNCKYDDMEEARSYHDGYKEGLDECYGQMPIQGYVGETTPPATVPGMAGQAMKQPAMEDDVEEGNAFTAALAKTPKGGKFSVGGKTFTDRTSYDAKVDESPFAFESWDNQLQSLLESKEEVAEGMTVSISKGQQGAPDSVSVTAQDAEADQLLGLIKQAGLGLFGGEEQNGYGAPQGEMPQHGGIDVVDDQDGMMALIKKVTGGEESADYADEEGHEEGHDHEDVCEVCGESQCGCDEGQEMVDEVESEDQMTYQVAEDNPPDSGAAEEEEEIQDTAQANASGAAYNPSQDVDEGAGGPEASEEPVKQMDDEEDDEEDVSESISESVQLDEWANEAGKKGTDTAFETDIDFMVNVISGGLNKRKVTGQTTIPVVASQLNRQVSHNTTDINESADPVSEWKKLAGI